MFEEDQLATGPQDTSNTSNGLRYAENCAQREGANRIDGAADDGHVQSELSVPAPPEGRILVDAPALYIFPEDRDSQGGYLISADLNLSRIRWTHKADRAWSSEWPRLWNGLLLAGNCRSKLDAFRISDGAPQWSDTLKGCLRSIGTEGDSEQIYVGAQEGTVYAYSPPLKASGITK